MTRKTSRTGTTVPFGIRLPVEELARRQAEADAARISTNELLVHLIREGNVRIFAQPKLNPADRKLVRYFRAASNNLNQIARRAHIDHQNGTLNDVTYGEILSCLQIVERYLAAKVPP